jgi:hypothetical protein
MGPRSDYLLALLRVNPLRWCGLMVRGTPEPACCVSAASTTSSGAPKTRLLAVASGVSL